MARGRFLCLIPMLLLLGGIDGSRACSRNADPKLLLICRYYRWDPGAGP